MIKSDKWIKYMCEKHNMISPYDESRIKRVENVISYGISSYGYDIRLSRFFKVPVLKNTNKKGFSVDPKDKDILLKFKDVECNDAYFVIEPNCYVLGQSVEYFRMPRNVLGIPFGKSTYARCGLIVNLTPFEPEWEGFVTISLVNPTRWRIKVYPGEGIAQVIFLESSEECLLSYADKKGKYQKQETISLPKV
jgi:dCTP deaminase